MNLKNTAISKLFAADHMKNDSNEFSSPNAHTHTHTNIFEYSFLFQSQQTVDCVPGAGLDFSHIIISFTENTVIKYWEMFFNCLLPYPENFVVSKPKCVP